MGERERERERGNDSSGYSWRGHIHGGHGETYTKWIMGQWRGRHVSVQRRRITVRDVRPSEFREGLRPCARAVGGERMMGRCREGLHSRLRGVHYAKRPNDRNICIFAHPCLWRGSRASALARTLIRARGRRGSFLPPREISDRAISRGRV